VNGVDGHVRGHVAPVVPAHAIGDDKQAQLRPPAEVVLVHFSRTDIGPASHRQIHIAEQLSLTGYLVYVYYGHRAATGPCQGERRSRTWSSRRNDRTAGAPLAVAIDDQGGRVERPRHPSRIVPLAGR